MEAEKVASQLIIGVGHPEIDEAYGNWKVRARRIAPCGCRESCESPKTYPFVWQKVARTSRGA